MRSTSNQHNLAVYRLYSPIYDLLIGPIFASARRRATELLDLRPGERVLLPGAGTGLDIALLSPDVQVIAADISTAMLRQARATEERASVWFEVMDATALAFPDDTFDAVLLSLVLSVVPDGQAAFREAWRVLRPGGRIVILDKFLPEGHTLTPLRHGVGTVSIWLGTDPNRRLLEILLPEAVPGIDVDEPVLLSGQYRVVRIHKQI
jgi:phosphatidylethanolamine/phosphatidyl-N-methylethanolamine N-methyltransferase